MNVIEYEIRFFVGKIVLAIVVVVVGTCHVDWGKRIGIANRSSYRETFKDASNKFFSD